MAVARGCGSVRLCFVRLKKRGRGGEITARGFPSDEINHQIESKKALRDHSGASPERS